MSAGNRMSLGQGIIGAFALSLCGAAVLAVLGPWFGFGSVLRAVIAVLGLIYVLYLVSQGGERIGRITTVACWVICAGIAWYSGLGFTAFVLVQVGLVWLVRSLYYYAGLLPALIDCGLTLLGTAFAVWAAQRTGSFGLALWCFFLVQAFHVLIPVSIRAGSITPQADDPFARAHRAAEAAVRRLSSAR